MVHVVSDNPIVRIMSLKVHEFCYRTLYCGIVSRDDPRIFQLVTIVIPCHFHSTFCTLRNINDVDTTLSSLFKQMHQPWLLWRIATSVCSHDDGAQLRNFKYMADNIFLDSNNRALIYIPHDI